MREDPPRSNRGDRVEQYQKAADVDPGGSWCYAFAKWCHDQAAKQLGGRTTLPPALGGSVRGWAHSNERGLLTFLPEEVLSGDRTVRPGDVAILVRRASSRDSARAGNRHSGHTYLCTGERDGDALHTIEGNTDPGGSMAGDGVYKRQRLLTDDKLVGFIRPTLQT